MNWFWKKKKEEQDKPEDEIEYYACFSCENGHCQDYKIETDYVPLLNKIEVCEKCGESSFPSVCKVTKTHVLRLGRCWVPRRSEGTFVRFLDNEDEVTLSEESVTYLKKLSGREFADADKDSSASYKNGLTDGCTMTAQYVLRELKDEETNA